MSHNFNVISLIIIFFHLSLCAGQCKKCEVSLRLSHAAPSTRHHAHSLQFKMNEEERDERVVEFETNERSSRRMG